MVVACWDGSVYILLSVSLPNKELNVTHFWLPGGELQRGAQGQQHTAIQVPGPWVGFQAHNWHPSSTEGPCPVTAVTAFLPFGLLVFSEIATPQRPVDLLLSHPEGVKKV